MRQAAPSELDRIFGSDNVAKLASAYEAVLVAAARTSSGPFIDRDTRLAIVTCLFTEARRGEFDPARLATTAMTMIGIDPVIDPDPAFAPNPAFAPRERPDQGSR